MKRVKKILKMIGVLLLILCTGLYAFFVNVSSSISDKNLLATFKKPTLKPSITYHQYKGFTYSVLFIIHNSNVPTLIFIHGSIGSCLDFRKYMMDSELLNTYNMIAYDRVGYDYKDINPVKESIAFERELLDDLISKTASKTIVLVGYSYGGPIALATQKKVAKIVLLAPAVSSEVELMPWMLNFYKWKLTLGLVPRIWQEASKEKISHPEDLKNFERTWSSTPNTVLSIHGTKDWIVSYSNSEYLVKQFPKHQFKLVTIPEVGHDLIWSQFSQIKQQLLHV